MKRNLMVNNSNQHQGLQILNSYFQTMIIFTVSNTHCTTACEAAMFYFITLCSTSVVIVCTGENEGRK